MAGKIIRCVKLAYVLLALPLAGQAANAPAATPQRDAVPDYDFAYRLSGDRRVAPIQVFDDGRTTWLQFQSGQTLPAVFVGEPGSQAGGQLASYTQQGPYVVLNGTAASLLLRIGTITARADYVGKAARSGLIAAQPAHPSQWSDEPPMPGAPKPSGHVVSVPATASRLVAQTPAQAPVELPEAGRQGRMARSEDANVLEFDVSLTDRNMRVALGRWARQAGWMFQAEHWAVDVDIPLVGVAAFGADFRHAVRTLLASTELADRPLQPCFYSNRVLRVVPLAQACDRTTAPAVGALAQS